MGNHVIIIDMGSSKRCPCFMENKSIVKIRNKSQYSRKYRETYKKAPIFGLMLLVNMNLVQFHFVVTYLKKICSTSKISSKPPLFFYSVNRTHSIVFLIVVKLYRGPLSRLVPGVTVPISFVLQTTYCVFPFCYLRGNLISPHRMSMGSSTIIIFI